MPKSRKLKLETCFMSIKKINIYHPMTWKKNELLQLARDISNGQNLDEWQLKGVTFTVANDTVMEWHEEPI